MLRIIGHFSVIALLTVLTQLGGIAWLASLVFRRRLLAFLAVYAAVWGVAFALAPLTGREALPCFGKPLRMQSAFYCVTMRNYVTPDLAQVAAEAAQAVDAAYPGTVTLALDGGFPFLTGMPLLPHLSHDDGEKLDLAFYYQDTEEAYLPGRTRSPVGYWAFELAEDDYCPRTFPTLRWKMAFLQPLWPDRSLEEERTAALIQHLSEDARVAKIFVEPPLAQSLGVAGAKIRFQGCRAARHDDHVHIQL
ncbi:hypothetical protein EU803_01520 [Loktanella sp. IMCC34160]|nr:hypothetical protein EU803_01520 [Loktanella sp. IMCC34160]